ncbi:MAG: hypothetical protein HFH85_15115 [Lachnospiraceae bacterium]|nr:hypothetical protein [Lachnospiraceae bacterium]
MAGITIEFAGLEELRKAIEELGSDAEVRKVNREIFRRCVEITHPRMKAKISKSSDNFKSGRKGYRPSGHAADNIPRKVTANYGEAGWGLLGDAENWFYMKFVEWGTTKQPPKDFIFNVREESDGDYSRIAEEEYQKLLNAKLGG